MATATMATAAGAAALLYYTLNRRLQIQSRHEEERDNHSQAARPSTSRRNGSARRPAQAPATWLETISTLSETLRFTYSETLGKWPIGDLAFGINFLLKRQGNLPVASIYAGNDSLELKGVEIIEELRHFLILLTFCWHFSKKPFPQFLVETDFSPEDVLLQEPKAGILKPAFTVLAYKAQNCVLLLIRGTHSIKDTLTAVTGAVVPFHHTVLSEGGISNLVLGYAHCGMVAAARWIAKLATPRLLKAVHEHPEYEIKIVGHSLGGGTAALLTYILREQIEFSNATCVAFAPAACMTWELAESGMHFVTSVINGSDLVPTFSIASVDDLRTEVTASAWLNDLRNQIEQTRIFSTVYRSASTLGSRLPSIATAKAKVAGAGAILQPVSNSTQVVMKRARNVAQAAWTQPSLRISSWSCMGPRRRSNVSTANEKCEENCVQSPLADLTSEDPSISFQTSHAKSVELVTSEGVQWTSEVESSYFGETVTRPADAEDNEGVSDGEDLEGHGRINDSMTEAELWHQLENELYRRRESEDKNSVNEIRGEEKEAVAEVAESTRGSFLLKSIEARRFFPPGKIMHIVTLPVETGVENIAGDDSVLQIEPKFGFFLTSRSLYGKLRLSQMMINDHYMPIYRRNIEKLISDMERDATDGCSSNVAQ